MIRLRLQMNERHVIERSGRLKENAARALEELGEGFLEDLRARPRTLAAWRRRHAPASTPSGFDASDELFEEVRRESLCLLYRLLFLFYAEGRGLVSSRAAACRLSRGLASLCDEIEAAHDGRGGKAGAFADDGTRLWQQLRSLFRLVREGESARHFGGGLFDLQQHDFLERFKVGDQRLARAFDLLSRAGSVRGPGLERLNYGGLDVRELGSVYETLLEFSVAPEGDATGARRFRLVRRGRASARRATGSYYTPDYVVRYLVEHTLGPLVRGEGRGRGGRRRPLAPEEILALRVLDPAVGGEALARALRVGPWWARARPPQTTAQDRRHARGPRGVAFERDEFRRRHREPAVALSEREGQSGEGAGEVRQVRRSEGARAHI
ncbi:MAG: BREX-1 system adenine-specific DNA-methyltransferase PglX [Acidobacteria bacterium]|nr:BREX-1 system adenine-specific DNA-methyltransferase PglX [Acidobacteriota bacterium]